MINTGIEELSKQKIIALINAVIPEASIYLFGSRARGSYQKSSDIDIALEDKKPISSFITGELMDIMAASNIKYKIQIVDINSVSEEMRENILKDRVLWKN